MIARLPEDIARSIRAQQYIQGSFIVVKELVENSLDANATQITVRIDDGIIVEDNGKGIEDLESVCKQGHTSKEVSTYQVLRIANERVQTTYGFRGQALASIAELSDVEIYTRCASEKSVTGMYRNYTTGVTKGVARESGTSVKVTNLFKECPVRRLQDERGKKKTVIRVIDLLQGYCYVHNVKFMLFADKKLIFSEHGSSNTKEYSILRHGDLSLEVTDNYFELFFFPYSDSKKQYVFLEKRIVDLPKLTSTVLTLSKPFCTKMPSFILILHDDADINISVDKREIILKNYKYIENRVKEELHRHFSGALVINSTEKRVKTAEPQREDVEIETTEILESGTDPLDSGYVKLVLSADSSVKTERDTEHIKMASRELPDAIIKKEDFREMKVIGQFNNGFILCCLHKRESSRKMLIMIDQHAADEIYNFEMQKTSFVSLRQKLLVPVDLTITPSQELVVEANKDVFERNGFQVENKKLLTVPVYKNKFFTVDEFYSLLENVENEIYESDALRDIMASKACRMSVMIGDALSHRKMREILDHLAELSLPWKCPHGRPTVQVLMDLNE